MKLSKNIRTLRINELKSQEEIAEYMNVSRQTISKWENGVSEPPLMDLIRIAGLFKVSLDELILEDLEKRYYSIPTSQLLASRRKNIITTSDDSKDAEVEDILFPSITPKDLAGYDCFSKAYYMDKQMDITKDNSNIMEMIYLYEEAYENGIIEAYINILRIVVKSIMTGKASNPDKPLGLQDKLEMYMESLEEIEHPAGNFYRAFVLIYGLIVNGRTDDDNLDDGIILMYKLSNEGNELAMKYVGYIEGSNEENDEY